MDPVLANTSRNSPRSRGATPFAQPDRTEPETEQPSPQLQNKLYPVKPIKELFTNDVDPSWWMICLLYITAPAYNVSRAALMISKNPIRWLVSAYSVWLIVSVATRLVTRPKTLSELSIVSGQNSYHALQELPPPDFRKLVALQSRLQGAMEKSTNTLLVITNIRRSEVAVRDLIILVEQSSLVGKERLAENLEEFVEDARTAGRNLQKFGGHVGGAVDETIAMNEYTIELLDRAAKDTQSPFLTRLLSPNSVEVRKKDIQSMWIREIRRMKSTIGQLVNEATANTRALDRLETELNVIHTIVARESELVAKGVETLNELWTALGGNKAQLAEFKSHNQLLDNVSAYRKAAMDHVTGALVHLEWIDSGLRDLNEPIASSLLGQAEEVPLEVHVTVMRKGTGRLMEVRAREREREDEYMRKILDSSYP
ncbi:hypothetical protein FS749_008120 [Ceratobasidium sp. UAMH 11750]|nr:hypothetical protein FS749_008120 [Ceratobasidium sp. UAMH 11750]